MILTFTSITVPTNDDKIEPDSLDNIALEKNVLAFVMANTIAGIFKIKFSELSLSDLVGDMQLQRVLVLGNSLIPDMITLISLGHAFYAFSDILFRKFHVKAKFHRVSQQRRYTTPGFGTIPALGKKCLFVQFVKNEAGPNTDNVS